MAEPRFRVLLVGPTALDAEGRPIKQKRVHLPGLTLPMLAAVTPDWVDIRLCHETVESVPYDEPWDLVGLTGMGSGIVGAWRIAEGFRARGVKVVIGGIAASLSDPELHLQHADSVVIGEAEHVWPEVLADAARGDLKRIYRMTERPNICELPLPRYDLMADKRYGFWRPVQATRGCPFTCSFCSITAFFDQGYRKRPVDQVVRDVRAAKKAGSKYIAFIDDNIGIDRKYATELFEALIPERILWMSQCSLQIAEDEDLMRLARKSGCRLLSFGIESVNPESLEGVDKAWNQPERYSKAIHALRRNGIDVSTEMIVGLDGDGADIFERTYTFLMENAISVPRVHIMTPIPGTPLYKEMDAKGRISTTDFGNFSGGKVVYQPKNFTPEALQAGYWDLYERLFTRRAIAHRVGFNPPRHGPLMRGFVWGVNFHYRDHIKRRITPGIV
ncbi:B12-binding domain-containing radical SAM protein [Rubricoccus marinus]|uniref:Uncharacterized protein n=1 Tax=Rubricoccus marinus TaxID=716817 RepID=A0A259U024_9BACT|nr:radical SAM protein [Rubricoccus marinus]OZC03300.1 hypothetical protein BSZ36_10100 [Rubricoccus marinus]